MDCASKMQIACLSVLLFTFTCVTWIRHTFFFVLIYTQSLCGFGPQTLVKQDTLQMLIALTTSIPAKARRFLTRSNSVLATKAMS